MTERLIAAARAVVRRWNSTDRNSAQTAYLIKELWDAADALAAQPARAGGDAPMGTREDWEKVLIFANGILSRLDSKEAATSNISGLAYDAGERATFIRHIAEKVLAAPVAALAVAPQPAAAELVLNPANLQSQTCGGPLVAILPNAKSDEQPAAAELESTVELMMKVHGLFERLTGHVEWNGISKPIVAQLRRVLNELEDAVSVQPAASTVPATEATDAEVKKWTAAAEQHEQELERLGAFSGDKDDMAVAIHATVARELRAAIARARQAPAAPAAVEREAVDAARYRWLRSTTNSFTNSRGEKIDVKLSPAEFDAAVDAARIGSSKEGGD